MVLIFVFRFLEYFYIVYIPIFYKKHLSKIISFSSYCFYLKIKLFIAFNNFLFSFNSLNLNFYNFFKTLSIYNSIIMDNYTNRFRIIYKKIIILMLYFHF